MTLDKLLLTKQIGLKEIIEKRIFTEAPTKEDIWMTVCWELSEEDKNNILSFYFTTVLGMTETDVNNFFLATNSGFSLYIEKKKKGVPEIHYSLFWKKITQKYPILATEKDVPMLSAEKDNCIYQLLNALLKTGATPPLESLAYITYVIR